jgi:hypothetical protein
VYLSLFITALITEIKQDTRQVSKGSKDALILATYLHDLLLSMTVHIAVHSFRFVRAG